MGFEVEKAFPYATRLWVVGKRDAGSDAPAKVQSSRGQAKACPLLLCPEKLNFRVPLQNRITRETLTVMCVLHKPIAYRDSEILPI